MHPYQGPKKERELRKQLRQQQQETNTIVSFPIPPNQEQKHNWLESALHYLVVLTVVGISLGLSGLDMFMGYNVAYEQASKPTAQLILACFNVASAALTFLLPHLARRVLWLVWGIFFVYSLYNTYTWMQQNFSDVSIAKSERKTSDEATLEDRYRAVKQQAYDECHTGKNGSQRGSECKTKETEAESLYSKLEAKGKERTSEETIDPRNAAMVKLLRFFGKEVSIDAVKQAVSILVTFIPPCGGLVFKFAVRAIRRR